MSNDVNTQLYDQISELMPDLPEHEKIRLKQLSDDNDLEALFQWQAENYGKILNHRQCSHPSQYNKIDDNYHCTQCDMFMGNRAHWE